MNAGKKPTTKKCLSFWHAFIALSLLFSFSLDGFCSGGAREEVKEQESALVPIPTSTPTTPPRKSRERPTSSVGSSARVKSGLRPTSSTPSEHPSGALKPQEEEGFRKRRHLRVSVHDHVGGNDIDFSPIHQAMAYETQNISAPKNKAIVKYSLICRNLDNENIFLKTFPLLLRTQTSRGTMEQVPIFLSGSDYDSEVMEGVHAYAQTPADVMRYPGAGFPKSERPPYIFYENRPLNPLKSEYIVSEDELQKFGAKYVRSILSAENFYAESILDYHAPRFLRPESAIASTKIASSLRNFIEGYKGITEQSLRNSGRFIDMMKVESEKLAQSHGDSEQTALRILASEDFEKQVTQNVARMQEEFKGRVKTIGIVFHIHSSFWPCNHCAPAIFADNEREDGYAKKIRARITGMQSGESPKVLTLVSYHDDWVGGHHDRGGGSEFDYRGVDRDVNTEDPIDSASFFPFIPVVKVAPSKEDFYRAETQDYIESNAKALKTYIDTIKFVSANSGPKSLTPSLEVIKAKLNELYSKFVEKKGEDSYKAFIHFFEFVNHNHDLFKPEITVSRFLQAGVGLSKAIQREVMEKYHWQIDYKEIFGDIYLDREKLEEDTSFFRARAKGSLDSRTGDTEGRVEDSSEATIFVPDDIIPLPTPRERNMNRFHAMVQEQGGTGVWREVLEILSSPHEDTESSETDRRVSKHLFTPPRPFRRELSEDALRSSARRLPLADRTHHDDLRILRHSDRLDPRFPGGAAPSKMIDDTGPGSDSKDVDE